MKFTLIVFYCNYLIVNDMKCTAVYDILYSRNTAIYIFEI